MKKKYIIVMVIILIIATIFVILINYKDNKESEVKVLNPIGNNVVIEDKYANLNKEEIDKLVENRSINNVSIKIKEGTLSKAGATLIITDKNDFPYGYGEDYKLERLENENWVSVKATKSYNINSIAHLVDENNQVTLELNWKERYGNLKDGKYRVGIEVGEANDFVYTEFEIK